MIILPLSVIILLLPFGIAFWQVYSHLDAKPLNLQMKRYYLISLPSLLVLISLIMMFYGKYLAMLQRN
jgi:hypothetical protein